MATFNYKELTADNLFDFCAILDAIGTDEIISAFNSKEITAMSKSGKNSNDIGVVVAMKIANIVIKSLPKARDEIYSFFAKCVKIDGKDATPQDIKNISITEFIPFVKDFFTQDGITDFFKQVSELVAIKH